MYLHKDKNLFTEVITEANAQTGIAESVIEKDYYVTMILKLLAKSNPDIVFKGGTSLSKCFHLINRFSEDIDITFSEHIGESRRKKLKYKILKPISDELGMPIKNWDSIESDKDYNYYLFGYQPASDYPVEGIMPGVKLETALVSYSFPTEERDVDSIIYRSIKDSSPDIITDYGLELFSMKVQSVSRTFIDKIFALRNMFSYVFQNVFLFSNTINANIAYSDPEAKEPRIRKAAKNAQASKFIDGLVDNYDTIIGERGLGLSGGQKQRLSIARAFLKNAPVLVLDDSTSALDVNTERALLDELKKNYKDRTVIITAHRLSSVVHCDEILYMQDGHIAERGTFDELMKKNGVFAEVYRLQQAQAETTVNYDTLLKGGED